MRVFRGTCPEWYPEPVEGLVEGFVGLIGPRVTHVLFPLWRGEGEVLIRVHP
jgi:hypothetical protein